MLDFNRKTCFNSNINLRKAGVDYTMPIEEADEVVKCRESYDYFVRNFVKVKSNEGIIPLIPYPHQEKLLKHFDSNLHTISLVPRQAGTTSVASAYLLWLLNFKNNHNCAIISPTITQGVWILDCLKEMFEHLPVYMQSGVKTWNTRSIEFENGSEVSVLTADSDNVMRGRCFDSVYMDGFAFNKNAKSLFDQVSFATTKESKVIITSTKPEEDSFFSSLCRIALSGVIDYKFLQVDLI